MRKSITLIFVCFLFTIGFAQMQKAENTVKPDSLQLKKDNDSVIIDAKYKGGINSFYNYIGNNFNFNNLKSTDILDEFINKDVMNIYVQFVVNEEGKPVDFISLNTTADNTFYKEVVRVISSTRWTPATNDGVVFSQKFRIPVQAYIKDFHN